MAEVETKSPLWMRITLLLSLAVNLLIVGLIIGVVAVGGLRPGGDRPVRDVGTVFTRSLDPEDRRALRRDFVSGLAEQGRAQDRVVQDLQETLVILRQSPFDPDAFEASLANQSERRKRREDIGREALTARIASMTDEERAVYADRVEEGLAELAKRMRRSD